MKWFKTKKPIIPIVALFLCMSIIYVGIGTAFAILEWVFSQKKTGDLNQLYQNAVIDTMYADKSEISLLFPLSKDSEMTTFNKSGERVLLLTMHNNPEGFVAGSEVSLSGGELWCFTDKEAEKWFQVNKKGVTDWALRFKQLLGISPQCDYTHISALWARPGDVVRPAYVNDILNCEMTLFCDSNGTTESYRQWFDNNILQSYYNGLRPWTRLGYTYDWADNKTEYGLSEFLIEKDSDVVVEFTKTTDEFVSFLENYSLFVPEYSDVKEKQKKVFVIGTTNQSESLLSEYSLVSKAFEKYSNKIQLRVETAETDQALSDRIDNALVNDADVIVTFNKATPTATDIVFQKASENLKTTFVIFDSAVYEKLPENVSVVSYSTKEAAFLAGFAAAKASKSGIIGFIGGQETQEVKSYEEGFKKGASFVNNNSVVLSVYTSSFTDEKTAENVAKELYQSGADIIFEAAGDSVKGIFKAAEKMKKQSGKYIICSEYDKTELCPERVLLSVVKNSEVAAKLVVDDILENGSCGGKNYVLNLANEGIDVAKNNGNMNDRIYNEVLLIKEKITQKDITVSK